jgi:uncharacterized membrane protein
MVKPKVTNNGIKPTAKPRVTNTTIFLMVVTSLFFLIIIALSIGIYFGLDSNKNK